MTRYRRPLALLILILSVELMPSVVNAQGMVAVTGQLIDGRSDRPAPGLVVSLVHPILGRSAPSFSNGFGQFGWSAIPVRPEPYFLEVYWNQNLIYRQPVRVLAPIRIPPIRL